MITLCCKVCAHDAAKIKQAIEVEREKAKGLEVVLRRISKMKADFGYRSPEEQDFKLTSLIVNYGHWADDALSKFEECK